VGQPQLRRAWRLILIMTAQYNDYFGELSLDLLAVGLGESRRGDRRDHFLGSFRHHREDVSHQPDPVSLSTNTLEYGTDSLQ